MTTFITLSAVLFVTVYWVFFGLLANPRWAVFNYAFIWLLFPKQGNGIPGVGELGPHDFTLFPYVQFAMAVPILIALLRKRPRWPTEYRPARQAIMLFVVVVLVANVVAILGETLHLYPPIPHGPLAPGAPSLLAIRVMIWLRIGGALIWCAGVLSFLRTLDDLEVVLRLLVLAGTVLVAEWFFFVVLRQGGVLLNYAVPGRRFASLTQGDDAAASLVAVLSAQAVLYFSSTRRRPLYNLLIPGLIGVVLATYERHMILGMAVSLGVFVWWRTRPSRRVLYTMLVAASAAVIVFMVIQPALRRAVSTTLATDVRPEPLSLGSLASRSAYQLRGLDVAVALPTGVGTGAVDRYLASDVPHLFAPLLVNQEARTFYQLIVSGERNSGTHNIVLQFMIEYGVFGLIALGFYGLCLFRNFRASLDTISRGSLRLFHAQVWTYASFAYLLVHYTFNHNPYQYFVWALILVFSFQVRRMASLETAGGQTEGLSGEKLLPAALGPGS